uniref:hypothetical protein n=1 Tax=Mycobacterium sp. HUMS_1102779 TaxID=3383487 RepID=UPI003899EA03
MCLALAGAAAAGLAAPAGADPGPNPFTVLSCPDCPQPVKKGGPYVRDQVKQGLRAALADSPDDGENAR